MAGSKLTKRRPGNIVRIKFAEKDKLLLSEDKIIIRRPGRTRKKVIMVKAKAGVMVMAIVIIVFVNIYCFVILTYPISSIFIF